MPCTALVRISADLAAKESVLRKGRFMCDADRIEFRILERLEIKHNAHV